MARAFLALLLTPVALASFAVAVHAIAARLGSHSGGAR